MVEEREEEMLLPAPRLKAGQCIYIMDCAHPCVPIGLASLLQYAVKCRETPYIAGPAE